MTLKERTHWYPNRRQWWVIWICYVAALFASVDSIDRQLNIARDAPTILVTFLVVGAALLVWRFARSKSERGW